MSRNRSNQTLNQRQTPSAAKNDSHIQRESQASQAYSPNPPISRTPSADRKILRGLTVSPENDYIDNEPEYNAPSTYNNQTPQDTGSSHTARQSVARQTAQRNQARSPAETYEASPNNTYTSQVSLKKAQSTRASTVASMIVLEIPTPKPETSRNEEWQANKTVAESNNYMLKYEVASDVTFAVGEAKEEIRAHKYMLMSRSPVLFKSLVKHLGNTDVKIGVPDIKPNIFREMLQYMYTDEFDIHGDNVTAVLFAAKKFQLKGLSSMCFQFLAAEMSDETVPKVMEQAHIYNETGLYEKCLRFIFANGNDVLGNPSFGQLCAECVEKVLRSDDLRASEEVVFEGSMTWANAECRRQKLQPTDEARRNVLGKLLYLIRFPLMGVTYFTQKVSLRDLLSHDEKLSIFQYYHGEEQQLPQRFSRHERKSMSKATPDYTEVPLIVSRKKTPIDFSRKGNVKRVRRFHMADGQWKQNGPPDAISFTTSHPIVLYGVEVFGACKATETYCVKLLVYDDISREEISGNDETIYTSPNKDTYDVYLTRPVRVPAKRVFTVVVSLKGCPTHKGIDGESIHLVDGVTFEFKASNRSSNGTDVTVGQISGLLFNKTQ